MNMMIIGKWKQIGLVALTLCLCLVMAESSFAAAYIKFDGIDGEATDKNHDKWIDVLSFRHEIKKEKATSDPTRQTSKAILGDVVVIKELDKSSPKLAESLLRNTVIPTAQLVLTRLTEDGVEEEEYLRYELKNVTITSYLINGSGQGPTPSENFSLNFEEIKVTYTYDQTDPATGETRKGNVEYTWKVEEGES